MSPGMEKAPVLFKGIAHSFNTANSLVRVKMMQANPTSKLTNPPSLTGSAISLVSVVQARNNARIMISGSLDLFGDRFFRSGVQKAGSPTWFEKSGNDQFVTEKSGNGSSTKEKVGETDEPAMYRIKDDLVETYEWSGKTWEPYVSDDVQVQFYMMSPYVLKTLSTDGRGMYHTSFKVPEVYGVFQFKIEYNWLGYTSLSLSKQMAGLFVFSFVHLYNK